MKIINIELQRFLTFYIIIVVFLFVLVPRSIYGKEHDKDFPISEEGLTIYDQNSIPVGKISKNIITNIEVLGVAPIERSVSQQQVLNVGPQLEPGFPVKAWHGPGSYQGGAFVHVNVANLDEDSELEILATSLAVGPLNAWNHDGTLVDGWPVTGDGAAYPATGQMHKDSSKLGIGIMVSFFRGELKAFKGDGIVISGWPVEPANYLGAAPSLADVDNDGLVEIFTEEQDSRLHAYKSDGSILDGWPTSVGLGGQERHTPAVADLDRDGDLEIVACTSPVSNGSYMYIYHHDGIEYIEPVNFAPTGGSVDIFPVIGDVDNDLRLEIIFYSNSAIKIYSNKGILKKDIFIGYTSYGSAPALADLDGDLIPEIVVLLEDKLTAYYGDGRPYPNFPIPINGNYWKGHTAPVVGDIDGDKSQEIVFTLQESGSSERGEFRVYNVDDGTLQYSTELPIGFGAVPAIADIDQDRKNEVIIMGSFWNGHSGYYDQVWAFDFGGENHGKIEWGQFGGNTHHRSLYSAQRNLKPKFLLKPY